MYVNLAQNRRLRRLVPNVALLSVALLGVGAGCGSSSSEADASASGGMTVAATSSAGKGTNTASGGALASSNLRAFSGSAALAAGATATGGHTKPSSSWSSGAGGAALGSSGGLPAAAGAVGNEPTTCVVDADCTTERACPKDAAMGCGCVVTPKGNRCVPRCGNAGDCPATPDQSLTCSSDGLCVGGNPSGAGGAGTRPNPSPAGVGPGPNPNRDPAAGSGPGGGKTTPGMSTTDTISDQAQAATIAFDGLAFVTGSFCAQTFYPPGKVADFFGFQYLRDNDLSAMGHNTDFTTLTADPILAMLNDTQLKVFADLGTAESALNDNYGYARFPLAKAFRRLYDGEVPSGKTALSREAVKAYSGYLFSIDGEMSYLRAQAYAMVLGSLDATQLATLAAMKGKGALEWTQPTQSQIDAVLKKFPHQMMRTYAGEMLAWYLGNEAADVYFCPERQGTYFGSFFMKDVKAMHNPSYTIDSNMTADMGEAFLNTLDSTQRAKVTNLVTDQKADLLAIVAKRAEVSKILRGMLQSSTVDRATVVRLAAEYGELDGEISYFYATAFSGLNLSAAQKATLMAERKKATAEDGGTPDYDTTCGNGYLYSAPLSAPPTVMSTDFMFGVCSAASTTCSSDWDCCSFSCANHQCAESLSFTSSAFVNSGTLPVLYTCDDANGGVSPPLSWSGVPAGTTELALTLTTEALDGEKFNWVLFHIPVTVTSLPQAMTGIGTAGVSTDGPELKYYPPCSTGPGTKTYTFTLHALSGSLQFSMPESQVNGLTLVDAVQPLTIASRQLSVSYARIGL